MFSGSLGHIPGAISGDFLGEVSGSSCKLLGEYGHVPWGQPRGVHANCLGNMDTFLGDFFGKFTKSLWELGQILNAFFDDCPGEFLRKLQKIMMDIGHILEAFWGNGL